MKLRPEERKYGLYMLAKMPCYLNMSDELATRFADKLDEWGFFEKPAGVKHHGAWDGGLYDHSNAVGQELAYETYQLGVEWQNPRSAYLVGILHDLCKLEDYEKDENGAWKHVKHDGHGERSVALAEKLLKECGMEPLTEEERLCIRWHMGFCDEKENWNDYGEAVAKYRTVLYTHTADMVATRVLGL